MCVCDNPANKKGPKSRSINVAHQTTLTGCLMGMLLFSVQPADSDLMPFVTSPQVSGETCIVELQREGTFGVRADNIVLTSLRFGGTGAELRVTSRKRLANDSPGAQFQITMIPPSSFVTAPTGGSDDVTFRARFQGQSISNGINFGRTLGTRAQSLPQTGTSVTLVTGNLSARKRVGTFPTGQYGAVATLLCE